MTTHYSAADVGALIEASERVCKLVARSPSMAMLRTCERVTTMEIGNFPMRMACRSIRLG